MGLSATSLPAPQGRWRLGLVLPGSCGRRGRSSFSSLLYRRESGGSNKRVAGLPESPSCFERQYRDRQDYIKSPHGSPSRLLEASKVCQERRKRSKPPHMVTLPQGWKFPGCQQRAASSRPSDLLALLFENQSRKGQRSSRHTPPTPAAGAIFNLLSLLGSPLRDLPMAVLHSYPLTQGGASHT